MKTKTRGEASAWTQKSKRLAASLLVAAMLLAGTMAAGSARAATTFTVNSTADSPDASTAGAACDTDVFTNGDQCTLRAAIQQANATAGADAINFAVPGTGVKTISVGATGLRALPDIKEQVTIDGYTQPGAHPNALAVGNDAALKIVLDGANAGMGADGLAIDGASGSVIKGLVIKRFSHAGIDVFSSTSANPRGTRIEGNFIGTDVTGTLDKGNTDDGVSVFANDVSQTVVGGTTAAARNVISGNKNGVEIGDTDCCFGPGLQPSDSLRIQGNYIGTDRSGTKDIGNEFDGIFLQSASGTTIGGKSAASRNVVSGNDFGMEIFFDSGTRVLGNRVGTTANGTGALGNDRVGVFLTGSTSATAPSNSAIGDGTAAGSNAIAFNGSGGVDVASGTGDEVSRNSIFSNGGLGIDLLGPGENNSTNVATPNDPLDADTGPNNLQNGPVLTSARTGSLKTTIRGKLESTPERTYTVEFYANPSNTNEGKKFVGETTFTTSVDGLHEFTFSPATKVPVGQTVTATATDSSAHDTSEFSAPRTVASS